MIRSCLLMTLATIAFSPILHAEDWPQFRGPTGEGISKSTSVPIEWSPSHNVAWKIDVPGQGWSSPVLVDGKLYLTSSVNSAGPVTLRALCMDAADGKMLWDTEVFRPDPAAVRSMHKKNTAASSTPIVADGRIYVHFGHLGTAALDPSGKVLWRQTELKYSPVHGNGGSPIVVGDKLIFNCDGGSNPFLVALDTVNGRILWKTPRNTPAKRTFSFCTPLLIDVDQTKQLISPGSGFVGGYDPSNGHELWRVKYGEGYSVVPRPVFSHGLLFVSSGFDQPILYAIKPEGAKDDATTTQVAWTQKAGAPNTPSTLAIGDEIYFIADSGLATCADARTGEIHWTHRLSGGYSASPVFAEGRIYFQNESGKASVIKADKSFTLLAENDLEERSLASYAVTDGTLFIRTEKHLWKISGQGTK
jgi:outer membrane protein assembly factor BamB